VADLLDEPALEVLDAILQLLAVVAVLAVVFLAAVFQGNCLPGPGGLSRILLSRGLDKRAG